MANHLCDSLHKASKNGHNECLITLLSEAENGINVNDEDECGRTPLYFASENGDNACIIRLLNAGADANYKNKYGWTPLHFASDHGDEECIKRLLNVGANVHKKTNIGLFTASLLHFILHQLMEIMYAL
jgi:ankyrin repeat protein